MKSGKKLGFECSSRLKEIFNQHYEVWRKKNGADLSDLANKCGVSSAYLAHLRRYGRIPSRPVLILLALNFGISGKKFFEAADIVEDFPYEHGLEIAKPTREESGLFSVKFNAEAFAEVVKSVVRSEVSSRTPRDLLRGRPLKIGLNYHQHWLFDSHTPPANEKHTGLFPEICRMLGLALQIDIELKYIPYASYLDSISRGEIDLFGPTMVVPNLPIRVGYSTSLYKLGMSALWRKRSVPGFQELPTPKQIEDLLNPAIKIAVTKNTLPHLLANTRLNRQDSELLLCSSDEEAMERITLRGLQRPAHLFLTNSMTALLAAKQNKQSLGLLFATRETLLDLADNAIAIRPDWPELPAMINEALTFLLSRGGLIERLKSFHKGDASNVVLFPD